MNLIGNIVWLFMSLTVIVMFLCVTVVGLAVLDYALDSDIKGALVKWLGPRHFLKRVRLKLLQIGKKVDTPSNKDIWADNVHYVIDPDYDKEIHDLVQQIEGNSK